MLRKEYVPGEFVIVGFIAGSRTKRLENMSKVCASFTLCVCISGHKIEVSMP